MVTIGTGRMARGIPWIGIALSIALLIVPGGCGGSGAATPGSGPVTLRIGFGLAALSSSDLGIGQTARNIAFDELVSIPRDGRTLPSLAERWWTSEDGLTLTLRLRSPLVFDDGRPVTAGAVCELLRKDLPDALGPAFDDVAEIRPASTLDVEFVLRRRSTFLLEALGTVPIV